MSIPSGPSKRFSIITSIAISIIAFTLWQIYELIMYYISPPTPVIYPMFLAVPTIIIGTFYLFVKLIKSTSDKQGYRKPITINAPKCLLLSAAFIGIYLLIYMFPAISTGTYSFQGISLDPILLLHRIASAILLTIAIESVFRGYVFRNLVRNHGFFKSLYASSLLFVAYNISFEISIVREIIRPTLFIGIDEIIIFAFTRVFPAFAAGLFLGFFFYKIGWSLLGPVTFGIGVRFFFDPLPILSPPSSPWWMVLTLEAISYVILIFIVDSIIKEPQHMRRRYGLGD